jgi:hypothetical protein
MNAIVASLDRELGRQWDKKKESFTRRRLMAYLLEDRSGTGARLTRADSGKKKSEPAKDSWLNDAFPISEKQNLVIFGCNPCPRRQLQL